MKTLGNLILMTAICIAVFMVFSAPVVCGHLKVTVSATSSSARGACPPLLAF
jgi:hypothetical protein